MMFYHPLEQQLYQTQINQIIQIHWEDLDIINNLDQFRLEDQQTQIIPAHSTVVGPVAGLQLDLVFPIQVVQQDSPQPSIV